MKLKNASRKMNVDSEIISNTNDILNMLDQLFSRDDRNWWNDFYSDRTKQVPFFTKGVDENLKSWITNKLLEPGKALEIGCGNGRNSLFLAKNGFKVTGIDFSSESIKWAENNMHEEGLKNIEFKCISVFDMYIKTNSYDFIYDSGCMHHIKPHRRIDYLEIVANALTDNGYFGLVCFNEKGGANISDFDVYRELSMKGGIAFTEKKLIKILTPYFKIIEIREMLDIKQKEFTFGEPFLWTVLLKKL